MYIISTCCIVKHQPPKKNTKNFPCHFLLDFLGGEGLFRPQNSKPFFSRPAFGRWDLGLLFGLDLLGKGSKNILENGGGLMVIYHSTIRKQAPQTNPSWEEKSDKSPASGWKTRKNWIIFENMSTLCIHTWNPLMTLVLNGISGQLLEGSFTHPKRTFTGSRYLYTYYLASL